MKALVSMVALVLGSAAVYLVVTIQNNPLAFTRLDGQTSVITAEVQPPVRIGSRVEAKREQTSVPESVTVWLEETHIVGRLPAAVRVVPVEETEPEVTVLPAPCTDGEYRLIEEQRGVRLMCNVSSP